MRLGGRASAAIEVLADIDSRHRPVSQALRDWGLSHRFAGSGDRSAIGNLVYDTLRMRASQAWRMDSDNPAALVAATLLGQWRHRADELTAIFADDRFAPELNWADLAAALNGRDLAAAPAHIRADMPEWVAPQLEKSFGQDWIAESQACVHRPPLDLRVNTLRASRDKVLKQLSRFGARACTLAPNGLRIDAGERDARLPNVQAEAGYNKGWFEIQDEGSQLAAALADAKTGEQVLDYCAGGGGKTLAFAAAMNNTGQVHAHDTDRNRLAAIHDRLRRAGTRNVQVHVAGSDLAALENRMDLVFVDAPCSGSGTWRRRPDTKWRLSEAALEQRVAEQRAIIDTAARFVRPGGRLVYVTCSVFPCENEDQVRRFLNDHAGFSSQPMTGDLFARISRDSARLIGDSMLLLSPLRSATDGFFVAAMERGSG